MGFEGPKQVKRRTTNGKSRRLDIDRPLRRATGQSGQAWALANEGTRQVRRAMLNHLLDLNDLSTESQASHNLEGG